MLTEEMSRRLQDLKNISSSEITPEERAELAELESKDNEPTARDIEISAWLNSKGIFIKPEVISKITVTENYRRLRLLPCYGCANAGFYCVNEKLPAFGERPQKDSPRTLRCLCLLTHMQALGDVTQQNDQLVTRCAMRTEEEEQEPKYSEIEEENP